MVSFAQDRFQSFYESVERFELDSSVSVGWIEQKISSLMLINTYYVNHHRGVDDVPVKWGSVFIDWDSSVRILSELSFFKREYLTAEFVSLLESWSTYNLDHRKLCFLAMFNDLCLSEDIYELIKAHKNWFKNSPDGEDDTDIWESAVYLFERYDRDAFSIERYNRVKG